jgi:glycosyltransferase involved in cell wall biosynthesis
MSGSPEAVTAVIPAYNAEATLDETLRSVRSQTHRLLEILVVDDGSRDRTPEIALAHAAADPRVRLIRQANGGVAAARNRGIAEATSPLVAPVDADDVWAPDKIARQLAAMRAGGAAVALVYTWSALIDADSRIIGFGDRSMDQGDVLARMCRGNLVGNGSAALMRRAAVLEAGGYSTSLRAQGAQGCEDLLLYCGIAARHRVAVVPDFLTGYRQNTLTMSRDLPQMRRSWHLVAMELRARHPELKADIDLGEEFAVFWLLKRALWARRLRDAAALAWPPTGYRYGRFVREVAAVAAAMGGNAVRRPLRRMTGATAPPQDVLPPRFPLGVVDPMPAPE